MVSLGGRLGTEFSPLVTGWVLLHMQLHMHLLLPPYMEEYQDIYGQLAQGIRTDKT